MISYVLKEKTIFQVYVYRCVLLWTSVPTTSEETLQEPVNNFILLYFTFYFDWKCFYIIKPHVLPGVYHCDFSKSVFFVTFMFCTASTWKSYVPCDRALKYSKFKISLTLQTEGFMLERKMLE